MQARLRHLRHRELDGLERGRLDHLKDALTLGIPAGSKPEYVFTADNVTDMITVVGENTLAVGNPRVLLTGALPTGLQSGKIYFLADTGTNTYSLHATKAAAFAGTGDVTFTTNGTGTLSMIILD